jgi:hypothetical protein
MLDGRPKPENLPKNLFDGIFCYKLPSGIFVEYIALNKNIIYVGNSDLDFIGL